MTRNRLLVTDGLVFPEAPRWRQGRLWFSDVYDDKLYAIEPDGTRTLVCSVPDRPLGIEFLADGTPVVVSAGQRKVLKITDGSLSVYADLAALAGGDVNDMVADETGRLYVGNFGYDFLGGAPLSPTDIHAIAPDGTISVAASGLEFPNGCVIKDHGRTFVVAETWSGRLRAFDRTADGTLGNPRVYAELGERHPDGICVDAEGGIWVACYNTGEFLRVLEGGVITDRIVFDGIASACVLGGQEGKTLYLCTVNGTAEDVMAKRRLGAIYAVEVSVPGPVA